jgi:hypothetical protein
MSAGVTVSAKNVAGRLCYSVLVGGIALAHAGCTGSLSVAVENRDSDSYLLRVVDGQHRAWIVPPGVSGLGPTNDGSDTRFVVLSGLDCWDIGRFGLSTGDHTLIVQGGQMANPDMRDSIDASLQRLEQIVDPCPA